MKYFAKTARLGITLLLFGWLLCQSWETEGKPIKKIDPFVMLEFSVGTPISGLSAVPVQLNNEGEVGIFIIYNEKLGGGGPNPQFYQFPEGNYTFMMFNLKGELLWRKDLAKNVVTNHSYCPVFPFDLDGDGSEEIWFVNNTDLYRPLASKKYVVEKLNPKNGNSLGAFKFPMLTDKQPLGNLFRLFLMGGYVKGEPVLLTGQGTYTYGPMAIHAYNSDLTLRWRKQIDMGEKGARGSHMSPIVDFDFDGNDELFWGERCIRIDDGEYLFIADFENYTGHSDIIQPVLNRKENKWYLYTCRENSETPRLVFYDNQGKRIWTDLTGHVDKGWVASFGKDGELIATALEINKKYVDGPNLIRTDPKEFAYDLFTGKKIEVPFPDASYAIPVDFNGDGIHELFSKDSKIYCHDGEVIPLPIPGHIVHASKFTQHDGEQIICYSSDGTVRVWADKNAKDNTIARKRYQHPYYKRNQKLTATGTNIINLGGL